MKNSLVLLVATTTLATTSLALAETNSFPDVNNHKNSIAIEYLKDQNVINGYPDGTFKPENKINRAELTKVLVEGQGITPDEAQYSHCFPDVKQEWFAPYVCYAKAQGWVSGYEDGYFRPAKTVSKVESLKMILNAYGFTVPSSVSAPPFEDIETDAWYTPFVSEAKQRGLLEETGTIFSPADDMQRSGVAENIFRTIAIKQTKVEVFSPTIIETVINMPITNINNSTTLIDNSDNSTNITYNVELVAPDYSGDYQESIIYKNQCKEIYEQILEKDLEIANLYDSLLESTGNMAITQSQFEGMYQNEKDQLIREYNQLVAEYNICLNQPIEDTTGPITCSASQHVESGTCVSGTQTCTVTNGTGQKNWNGSQWGDCQLASCDTGFTGTNGVCAVLTCATNEYGKDGVCVANGSLTITLDPYTPSTGLVQAGTTSNNMLQLKLNATNEKIIIKKIVLNNVTNATTGEEIEKVTLYAAPDGSSDLVEIDSQSAVVADQITFDNLDTKTNPIIVDPDTDTILYAKVDLRESGTVPTQTSTSTSGDVVQLRLLNAPASFEARGYESGEDLTQDAGGGVTIGEWNIGGATNITGNAQIVRTALITNLAAANSQPSSGTLTSGEKELLKLQVTVGNNTNTDSDIVLKRLKITIAGGDPDGASSASDNIFSSIVLYRTDDPNNQITGNFTSFDSSVTSGNAAGVDNGMVYFTTSGLKKMTKGKSYIFIVKGTLASTAANSSLQASITNFSASTTEATVDGSAGSFIYTDDATDLTSDTITGRWTSWVDTSATSITGTSFTN